MPIAESGEPFPELAQRLSRPSRGQTTNPMFNGLSGSRIGRYIQIATLIFICHEFPASETRKVFVAQ